MVKERKGKKILSIFLKILKWLFIGIAAIILLGFVVRAFKKAKNSEVPKGGINESMYIDVNNSTQFISIYGQNINNPVILHLHGGPGEFSSPVDYVYGRKWADVYTVVTWDQRNCGLSYSEDQNKTTFTYDLFMKDAIEVTKYVMKYLKKDKIALVGHSFGSYLGANLSLKYPEYYNLFIGSGQLIDMHENEVAFKEAAKEWAKNDKETQQLIDKLDVNNLNEEYFMTRGKIMNKYNYQAVAENPDYNMYSAVFFNPHYSLGQLFKYFTGKLVNNAQYNDFVRSPEFEKFSLLNQTEYKIPYYNILGDRDYQTNYIMAEKYFNDVKAPRKKLYIMKNMTHGSVFVRTGEYSKYIHEIFEIEKNQKNTNNTNTN